MSGTVYLRKDGRYEARISLGKDENGRRHYRSFYGNTPEEAELKMTAGVQPTDSIGALTEMTVRELATEYIVSISPRLKESSEANYRMKVEKHIIPAFGDMMCAMLRVSDVYALLRIS